MKEFNIESELNYHLNLLSLSLSDKTKRALIIHFNEVDRWGISLGLTHAKGRELLIKHTIDSLTALPYLLHHTVSSVIDVGSGAGFPGLCLAAAMPSAHFYLLERKSKRLGFLIATQGYMALNNVTVLDDIKKVGKTVSCVTFRALTAVDCRIARYYLGYGAQIMAYKGRHDASEKEAEGLKPYFNVTTHPLVIDAMADERSLLVIKNK